MSADLGAEKLEKPERWFEVEVLLFKQLGNKAALKEQFPDGVNASNLPNYKQSFDLLNPYLQPNLTRIKQFASLCGEKDEQHLFLESLQSVSTPFPDEIQLIEQVAIFNMPDFTQEVIQENIQAFPNENSADGDGDGANESYINGKDSGINTETEASEPEIIQELIANTDDISEGVTPQPEVVAFEFDLQKEVLDKPIFSTENLCVITQKEMESIYNEELLANINLDSFGVDVLPSRLNASGAHTNNSPYLIADESLLLKDISQRLRWSKEFKPLLHFGWRQVGITKNKAIPLKLFAGEHLEHKYQQTLTEYQTELEEAKAIEQNLFEQLTLAQNTMENTNQVSNQKDIAGEGSSLNHVLMDEATGNTTIVPVNKKLKIKAEHNQQALNQLFSRIEFINNDSIDTNTVSNIVNGIDEQNLESILSNNDDGITLDNQLFDMSTPPKKPLQPWLLDGFIKIHLDHYLYINVDFNVFNQNHVKTLIEDDEINDVKLINFSQNRRVITGEIHYFDHPYMGMVVQIRRFDPTKPVGEQVSQAIK
jgi:hypothetical protein